MADSTVNEAIGEYVALSKTYISSLLKTASLQVDASFLTSSDLSLSGLGDLLSSAIDEAGEAFGDFFDSLDNGLDTFELDWSVFNGVGGVANQASKVVNTNNLEALAATKSGPLKTSAGQKNVDQFTEKNPISGNGCAQNQYSATVQQIINNVANPFPTFVKKGKQALDDLSFTDLSDDLFSYIAENLNSYYDLEIDILNQIDDQVARVNESVEQLEIDRGRLRHEETIRTARAHLLQARLGFLSTLNRMRQGAGFDKSRFDAAQLEAEASEDVLCNAPVDVDFPDLTKMFEVLGRLQVLIALRAVWLREQKRRRDTRENLRNLGTRFNANLTPNSVLGPLVDFIRCRLEFLINDMSNTLAFPISQLQYLVKEKEWCLGLKVLTETIRVMQPVFELSEDVYKLNLEASVNLEVQLQANRNVLPLAQNYDQSLQDYIEKVYEVLNLETILKAPAIVRGLSVRNLTQTRISFLSTSKADLEQYLDDDEIKVLRDVSKVAQIVDNLADGSLLGDMMKGKIDTGNIDEALFGGTVTGINNLANGILGTAGNVVNCLQTTVSTKSAQAAREFQEAITRDLASDFAFDAEASEMDSQRVDDIDQLKRRQQQISDIYQLTKNPLQQLIPQLPQSVQEVIGSLDADDVIGFDSSALTSPTQPTLTDEPADETFSFTADSLTPFVDASLVGISIPGFEKDTDFSSLSIDQQILFNQQVKSKTNASVQEQIEAAQQFALTDFNKATLTDVVDSLVDAKYPVSTDGADDGLNYEQFE